MNRMTYEGSFCEDIALCDPAGSTCGGKCKKKQIWERLKAYEDTGLSPEEIMARIKAQGGK